MRSRYIVCYDVSDPKRLREVFRAMKGFGQPLQYSVFQCDLTLQARVQLMASLGELINHEQDRVIILDLGPVDGRARECVEILGRQKSMSEGPERVI